MDCHRKLSICECVVAKSLLVTRANMTTFQGSLANKLLRRYLNFCKGILPLLVVSRLFPCSAFLGDEKQ